MDLQLTDNLVVITGGNSGIGFACALEYLKENARVCIVSRSLQNLKESQQLLHALVPSGRIFTYPCDLSDADAVEQLVIDIENTHGPIDILVNSTGSPKKHNTFEITTADWHQGMNSKYFLYMHMITHVIARMKNRSSGSIVNVAGMGGKIANKNAITRGAASSAIMLATAGLAHEYGAFGVRVNVVNPTYTLTEALIPDLPRQQQHESLTIENAIKLCNSNLPIGRLALPKEVADAVLFLSSPKASYISGVSLSIDAAATPILI